MKVKIIIIYETDDQNIKFKKDDQNYRKIID